MEVEVTGSVDGALRVLKRKLNREGFSENIERHAAYLKPGERRKRKRRRAESRRRRMAAKLLLRR